MNLRHDIQLRFIIADFIVPFLFCLRTVIEQCVQMCIAGIYICDVLFISRFDIKSNSLLKHVLVFLFIVLNDVFGRSIYFRTLMNGLTV